MKLAVEVLPWFAWTGLWAAGGCLVVGALHVRRRERLLVGISLGLVLQLWFSNLYAQILPVPLAFWLGSATVLLLGFAFAWPHVRRAAPAKIWPALEQILVLGLQVYLFTAIGRGLGIFDDYQNVPTVSLMAAGDIPPRFALDPTRSFGYHHLLLLFAAQTMRLADVFPWTALDVARGVVFGLAITLCYLWTRRMTHSRLAGYLGAGFAAFCSGARWILLILPRDLVEAMSKHISLIGTGATTAGSLAEALLRPWEIDGGGPMGFPFAYRSGIVQPAVMAHGGVGAMPLLLVLLFLLLYRHWTRWQGFAVAVVLLAASALVNEVFFLALLPNLIVAVAARLLLMRKMHVPRSSLPWMIALVVALAAAAVQGGVLTALVRDWLASAAGGERLGYHTFSMVLSWPPSLVSAHLGVLHLTDPWQLLVAGLEIGPVVLVLPLVLAWGVKMIRCERWGEAILITGALTGLVSLVFQYRGTAGISANVRLLGALLTPAILYAVPLTWAWAKRRGESVRLTVLGLGLVAVFGGVMDFGTELVAIQKPALPMFIHELDARMARRHWNRLPADALVFDPWPARAVTVFGRPTDSHLTWYEPKPEWLALAPDPHAIHSAGFDYVYFGIAYWETLAPEARQAFEDPCVRVVDEVHGVRSAIDLRDDFRRLVDISACR